MKLDARSLRLLFELVPDLGIPSDLLGVEVDVGEVARNGVEAGHGFADFFSRGRVDELDHGPRFDFERVFLEDQKRGIDMLARGKGERGHLKGKIVDVRQPGCAVSPVGCIVHHRLGQLHLPFPEGLANRSRSAAAVPCVAGGVSHAKLGHELGEGLGGGVLAGDLPLGRGDALFKQPVPITAVKLLKVAHLKQAVELHEVGQGGVGQRVAVRGTAEDVVEPAAACNEGEASRGIFNRASLRNAFDLACVLVVDLDEVREEEFVQPADQEHFRIGAIGVHLVEGVLLRHGAPPRSDIDVYQGIDCGPSLECAGHGIFVFVDDLGHDGVGDDLAQFPLLDFSRRYEELYLVDEGVEERHPFALERVDRRPVGNVLRDGPRFENLEGAPFRLRMKLGVLEVPQDA